jgi:hypothetical protein
MGQRPATVSAEDEGKVVLVRARLRKVYAGQGIATVRYITPGSEGGPGFKQEIIPLGAVAEVLNDPDDERLVPRRSW